MEGGDVGGGGGSVSPGQCGGEGGGEGGEGGGGEKPVDGPLPAAQPAGVRWEIWYELEPCCVVTVGACSSDEHSHRNVTSRPPSPP